MILMALFISVASPAQRGRTQVTQPEGYKFTTVVNLDATPVRNQARTGTCWCFATMSFIESELIRMGKGEHDLSEMYVVRHNYMDRIKDNYLRHGKGNLGPGSLAHDVMRVIASEGMVPESAYSGLVNGNTAHNHGELQSMINAIAEVPVKVRHESDDYYKVVNAVLDTYLGEMPTNFTYKGKNYTPKSFTAELGFNPADYVEITSFSHHPFYTKAVVEVQDNWTNERMYNVPINELIQVMDYALEKGYTVDWDGDVSEKGFSHATGVAINPEVTKVEDFVGTDRARFENMNPTQRLDEVFKFERPFPEINVTQAVRQAGYESFVTTDDHLMHITGMVKDQNGTKYYTTKNSWGPERSKFDGYLHMSESYVKAKVIFIMVHKDAVPAAIRAKLGF